MVTVVNTPQGTVERSTVERTSDDSSAGWAVAVIVLLAIVAVGGFLWLRAHPITYSNGNAATPNNVNVTLPDSSTQNTPPQNNINVTPSTPAPTTRTQNINVTPTPTPAPTTP